MSKVTSLFIVALILCFTLSCASRPHPEFHEATPLKTQNKGVETEQVERMDESCEGIGEEECLNRRTLVAHLDYIYTQKQKP
ncbi:hypothetical protein LguiA_006014 [Lonicera macranthoides]